MSEFQVGDVVKLKSGGPTMTIQEFGSYGAVKNGALCVWFDGKEERRHPFEVATLKHDSGEGTTRRVERS